jgi:hypothetical protein
MRLALAVAIGVVGIAVATPVGALRDAGPPRPRRCHGTKDCSLHRYELFAVTFRATQRHVWTLPRGDTGVHACWDEIVSGAGDMTLSLEAPRPTYALVRHGFGAPFFYWHSPSGVTLGGFDVRASLSGFGWWLKEYIPVGEPCRAQQVLVGSADPAACQRTPIIELLVAGEENRDGWLEGADGPKHHGLLRSECPIASYTEILPRLVDGLAGPQEFRLLRKDHGEALASRLSTRKVFDCRKRTLTSVLPAVRRDSDGPVEGWDQNDPNSPSWPHWHMTTNLDWKFVFRRIGCGKR